MKVLKNQTLFQCDHCGKRLLTKYGAKIHEEQYCSVVLEQKKKEKQAKCKHKNIDTHYEYILGEAVMQPAYDYCVDCDKQIGWGERND
ncbi:hypothetical protein BK784_26995 [Bacillus thuringiensis serovar medellin]|uniref:C2H2-type domain-containing protein n=1 Tax=Bacillus thuringiensis subsp. medellin TaxID=79672 RepID=A0A9X6RBL4_BACTV|nr:hypothetical protein [Bacillus thuringiensis]OUB89281.1 hypothetical protein BK784_26995 [Bacillus thuringiensis serovar medellin]